MDALQWGLVPYWPKPNNAVTSRKVVGFFSVSETGFWDGRRARLSGAHQVLWQQESPCVSGKGGPYGKQSKGKKGRVVVPAGAPQILD